MGNNNNNPESSPEDENNNHGGEQTDKSLTDLRKIALFLDSKKGTNIGNQLNTINNSGNFLYFVEQLKSDTTTYQLGENLDEIYRTKFADTNTNKPIVLKITSENGKQQTIEVKMNLSDRQYMELHEILYTAISSGATITIIKQGEAYISIQDTVKEIVDTSEIYKKIYTELGGEYSNLQNLCVLFFGDFKKSPVLKNHELVDIISEITTKENKEKTQKLQEEIFLEILYRYIHNSIGDTADVRFTKDIKNIFKTKKIYFSIYSGDTEYDDRYPLTFEYNLENVVLFIIELQYIRKMKKQKYYIDISGTPQKGNIVTNN